MVDKKVIKLSFILVMSFLLPLILIYFFSIPSDTVMTEVFRSSWAESMTSYINKETLGIIINNLIVAFVMCLFSIIPFFVYNRKERDSNDLIQVTSLISIAYILYFLKQGFVAGLGLLSFPNKSYLFGVFVITLPHGLLEITGFAIAAAATFCYFKKHIDKSETFKYLALSTLMILTAGILETTLTPFLFRYFV